MDSRCEEVFSPTGAFNINIAIDVKEREKSEYSQSLHRIRMQSTRALPSKHPNKRKRTPFRWHGSRSQFLQTSELPYTRCARVAWMRPDSTNSSGFVRSMRYGSTCVCASTPSHLLFEWYSLLPWRRDLLDSIFLSVVPSQKGSGGCKETEEIVCMRTSVSVCVCECRRLVEIDIREVSMFRQLNVRAPSMSMAPFDWESKLFPSRLVRQRTAGSILDAIFFLLSHRSSSMIRLNFRIEKWHESECNLTILSKQYYRLNVDQSNGVCAKTTKRKKKEGEAGHTLSHRLCDGRGRAQKSVSNARMNRWPRWPTHRCCATTANRAELRITVVDAWHGRRSESQRQTVRLFVCRVFH